VSVSLDSQSCADAESDQKMISIGSVASFERVSVEVPNVQMPEGNMEKKRLQGSVLFRLEDSPA
jgi:hypothetical protein